MDGGADRQVGLSRKRSKNGRRLSAGLFGSVVALAAFHGARAETLESALARAYGNSPTLDAQRANVRSIDETVPQQKAGFRPRVTAAGELSANVTESNPDRR